MTEQPLAEGVSPSKIMNRALIVGTSEVETRLQACSFCVPELLITARAMQAVDDCDVLAG